jgi:aconitase A
MSLTEQEITEYFKLKEKKDKQNKYFYSYIKNKIKNTKETNQEEYKKTLGFRLFNTWIKLSKKSTIH